jgi:hypothetical protein
MNQPQLASIDWSKMVTADQKEAERLEKLAIAARADRDSRIKKTDFYLLPDAPPQPEGLLSYRQALRDITEQEGFPENVVWPELPTG